MMPELGYQAYLGWQPIGADLELSFVADCLRLMWPHQALYPLEGEQLCLRCWLLLLLLLRLQLISKRIAASGVVGDNI